MQTSFTPERLADPDIAEANAILRACVHCGFCTATCPTYVLLGDELDSPRGRIYLIKDMLERDCPAPAKTVRHVDRCLSCLSCMTTCPSGVHYMHLVDLARAHIEKTHVRPLAERWLRRFVATVLPRPTLFRLALLGAALARPFARLLPRRLGAMIALAPRALPGASAVDRPQVFAAEGPRRGRVALMTGCVQQVLAPEINEATVRVLTRHGIEVVIARGVGCCGALVHHMGREREARAQAARNIRAWLHEVQLGGLDAIIVNASGCGTTVKDYGFMFRTDPALAQGAERISALAKDVTEYLSGLDLKPTGTAPELEVVYHSACSMQHGQRIVAEPRALLAAVGFRVREAAEGHLCCGSAGTYSLFQPELSARLRERKVRNLEATGGEVVATANIGCLVQIAAGTDRPVVHLVELLDWATGGPVPQALAGRARDGAAATSLAAD